MTKPITRRAPTPKEAVLRQEKVKRQALRQKARWRLDPVAFADEALGVTLWEDQIAVARDVAAGHKVSWRASQKVGKSLLFAVLALWRIYCFDGATVVMTSGNLTQVKSVLWKEIRKRYNKAKIPLGPSIGLDPTTGLTLPNGSFLTGLTVRDPEKAGGYSDDSDEGILVLIDEASGVDDEIITAFRGNMAGGGAILLGGNPTRPVGFFARTHREKLKGWDLHHTSALNSPNIKAGKIVVKGLAEPSYPQSMADDFGAESAAYAVRVLGEFPGQQDDCVVPLELLDAATAAWSDIMPGAGEPLCIGVDPAGVESTGDESVIQGVIGKHAFPASAHRSKTNPEVGALALEYVAKYRQPGQRVIIRVDVIGLGQGVADFLQGAGLDPGITVERIKASNSSTFPGRLVNMRAQQWYALRQWLKRGGTLPKDQKQEAEILAAKTYVDPKLRQGVQSKDEMKKTLKRSPDRADALCLAVLGEHPLGDGEGIGSTEPIKQPSSAPRPYEGARVQSLSDIDKPKFQWRPGMGRLPSKSGL